MRQRDDEYPESERLELTAATHTIRQTPGGAVTDRRSGIGATERRMRVGFDARWYNDSGVGTYVGELLKAIASFPDFDLVIFENSRNPVPVIDGAAALTCVSVSARKYSFAEQIEFRRLCREHRIDVLHVPFHVVPMFAGVPTVITVHDLIPFRFNIYPLAKRAIVRRACALAAKRAAQIIAVSRSTARDCEEILGIPPDKMTVIPEGPGSGFHQQRSLEEYEGLVRRFKIRKPYVVVASARNWRTKNLGGALQALAHAHRQSGVRFQTVVYGPPEGLRAVDISDLSALNIVQTGFVTGVELGALFRHAHAFLMPSLYEGFGLPILEAMACGCAVITSNRSSLPEVCGNGGQLFDPSDISAMGESVAQLLSDAQQLRRWQERALERASQFSWQTTAEQTLKVYRQVYRSSIAAIRN